MSNIRHGEEKAPSDPGTKSFLRSHLILLDSRKKWALLYSLATLTGLLCVPGILDTVKQQNDILLVLQKAVPVPFISLLVAVGMYIFNDLMDAQLDKNSGKQRPIPSGLVSRRRAWSF